MIELSFLHRHQKFRQFMEIVEYCYTKFVYVVQKSLKLDGVKERLRKNVLSIDKVLKKNSSGPN